MSLLILIVQDEEDTVIVLHSWVQGKLDPWPNLQN